MAYEVLLEGNEKLARKLALLSEVTQRRIVRPAVSKALTPIMKDAKRRCPADTKQLRKSIGKTVKVIGGAEKVVWGAVGPRRGFKIPNPRWPGHFLNPTSYAHFVEFGTRHAAARPFLRPAMDGNRSAALAIIAAAVKAGLAREAAKA